MKTNKDTGGNNRTTGIRCSISTNNELLIYGFVGDDWDELDAKTIIQQVQALGDLDELVVRVNSGGGFVFEGLAIYNFLNGYKGNVSVFVDGIAASMASVICMAGDTITMPENALMMIHNPWDLSIGDADQLRKDADVLEKVKDSLVSVYVAKTGKSRGDISELMDAETWFSAQEALDNGFIDVISSSVASEDVARVDVMNFIHTPDQIQRHRMSAVAGSHPDRFMAGTPCAVSGTTTSEDVTMKPEEIKAAEEVARVRAADEKAANDKAANDRKDAEATAASKAAKAATSAERKRASDIRAAVKTAKLDDEFADSLVDSDITVDAARASIINKWAENGGPDIRSGVNVMSGDDVVDKFRSGAQAAIMARSGLCKDDGQNNFRGFSLRELARESLNVRNVDTRNMSVMTMVAAAFTHSTGDFPLLLANTANKSMLLGWDETEESFDIWTTPGVLTDFKVTSRVDLNSFPSLREVRAGAEYKYASMGERGESIILLTYGELFSIDRQAIINDDLGAFTRVPQKMGRAAKRTVGDLTIAVLTANPDMADGVALFHATHNNLAGTGTAPTTTTVQAGKAAMMTQTDGGANAHALNLVPKYFLVPVALDGTARVIMASETKVDSNQNNSKVPNSVAGLAEVVPEARLDADSTTAWYLTANGKAHDTIEVAYLDGNDAPLLEQREGWGVDGVEFKVRIDAGVAPMDFRTMYRNPGA
jgi:ATP-dependent Clp endopeptidase proteolytic subunit ClpP